MRPFHLLLSLFLFLLLSSFQSSFTQCIPLQFLSCFFLFLLFILVHSMHSSIQFLSCFFSVLPPHSRSFHAFLSISSVALFYSPLHSRSLHAFLPHTTYRRGSFHCPCPQLPFSILHSSPVPSDFLQQAWSLAFTSSLFLQGRADVMSRECLERKGLGQKGDSLLLLIQSQTE